MLADDQKVELPGVEGVLIYRDSLDPDTYYYASTRPAVSLQSDGYQFTLVRYDQPRDGQAGMLSFVVDLEPSKATYQSVLAGLLKENSGAQLKQMPWTSGCVAAAIIGGSPVYSTPSLIGRNSAVIAMGLSTDQYLILKNSLNNASSPPISIVYKLTYDAFRRAYGFSVDVNQQKFRDWVQQKCSANILFINVETTSTFEELILKDVITVKSVNETGDPPPDGFKRAFMLSLQSLLTPLPRFGTPPEGGDAAWLLGFDCSTVHDTQNISRKLDSKMEVSGAVIRSAFIQGPLENLAEAWHTRPEVVLPTSGGFKQSLVFRCDAAFDGHPLDSVSVVLNGAAAHTFYKDHIENWPVELVYDPRRQTSYSYYCDLTFNNVPQKGKSPVRQISREQAYADLVPSESYIYRRFDLLAAEEFPWDLIKHVSITSQSTPNPLTPPTLQLTPTKRTAEIEFFSLSRQALDDLVFFVSYVPLDGSRPIDQKTLPSGTTVFLNPFQKRIVKFLVSESFDWPQSNEIKIAFKKPMGMLVSPKLATTTIKRGGPPITFTTWYTDKNCKNLSYRISPPTDSPWKEAKSTVVKINSPAANDQTDGEQAAMERTLL
ncbi:MAG TPA: hypothetical protein VJT71_16280 [Pyrinomonadaceae bacterium]|nr:hypothetical protein [Pyrinomonadaceae bacterium]